MTNRGQLNVGKETWTAQDIARLKAMYADSSVTLLVIAARLHKSRASVASKIHRLGLPHRLTSSHKLPATPPIACTVPLAKLGPHDCRWPEGDPKVDIAFCGAPVKPGRPYCAAHCQRAYYSIVQLTAET